MPRERSSASKRGEKAADSSTKRKRDTSDAGNLAAIQKRRTDDNRSREAGREWNNQYYQGVSISELSGMGCGAYRLGTPRVPFQAPFTCDGRLEIMSGTDGEGSGSIRLCGPQNYWGGSEIDASDAVFMVPFKHIEQVIILPIASGATKNNNMAYQVIIVPTGATGASSVKRQYPQIISFSWPGMAADDELKGTVGEAANPANDTYLSILKQVMNEQLEALKKSIIDESEETKDDLVVGMSSILSPPMGSNIKSKVDGNVHFMGSGILFNSEALRMYLPFSSLERVMVVQARDMKGAKGGNGRVAAFSVLCSSTEPYYSGEDESSETTLISFGNLDSAFFDKVQEYLEKHGVQVMLCEQVFYDYKKDQPMSGFMPIINK